MTAQPPAILLVYANDRVDPSRHLRSLADEIGLIRDALRAAEQAGLCQVLIEANASAGRVLQVFQDDRYRGRIAVFHYAGHADGYRLLLESATGQPPTNQGANRGAAHAAGLAAFLGEQRGLELVFLNGCSTAPQVQGLLDAGCPAVIATSQAIDDRVATELAGFFYQGLGGGAGLESAFKAAVAATRTTHGDSPRGLYWGGASEPTPLAERWPWDFHTKPGAERAQHWNLPEAADDPLFGLPGLPRLDLPDSPFRHLSWFDREHAEVFFGRAFQVRELFDRITAPDAPPILLFYGQSGIGKSSVLAAGLLPRLEASHRVHYLRRDPALGLFGTLMQPLGARIDEPGAAWHQAETAAGVPLLLILDQAEEVFTRPAANPAEEVGTLLAGLQAIFGQPQTRPRGHLILSFRKEWLPEIEARLADRRLPCGRLFLEGLDERGIIAAVEGPTRGVRLHNAYGLQLDAGLAQEIANDLLADPDSPIAPTLQILLTKLWAEARRQDDTHPRFSRDLYLKLKREGILLKDFLDQQFAALEQWRPAVVQSGLALDLLAAHTTPTGTADQRTEQELLTSYAQVQETLPTLLQRCTDGYLLTDIPSTGQEPVKGTRLAHDTLAPLVRARFEESDHPGQRARRILDNRAVEWRAGESGAVLDEADLAVVEGGVAGMRDWDSDERRLIEASRQAREERGKARQRLRALIGGGLLAIVSAGLFASWQWWQAERERDVADQQTRRALRQERIAVARLTASQAAAERDQHPIRALLLAAESVKRPLDTDDVFLGGPTALLREVVATTGGSALAGGGRVVAIDPRGRWLASGGKGATVRLWDLQHPKVQPRVLRGSDGDILSLAFDAKGRWLAGGSTRNLQLWDLQQPEAGPQKLRGNQLWIETLAFDPRGRWLAGSGSRSILGDHVARVWDLDHLGAEPRELKGHEREIQTLAFDPLGRWLATAGSDGTVRLWDLGHLEAGSQILGGPISTAPIGALGYFTARIATIAFDPQGRWLAGGSGGKPLRLWDLRHPGAEPQKLYGHEGGIETLAFDPRGRWLASGSWDKTARLWDPQHPEAEPRVLRGHSGRISILAFDPQGRWLATGSDDRTARLWDLVHPAAEPIALRGHDGGLATLAFDPQGRWLATGADDQSARLWDLRQPWGELRVLRGHAQSLGNLAFDSQGRWLVTGSWDKTARVWDLQHPAAEPRVVHGHEAGVRTVDVDATGRWLITGGGYQTAWLWDLAHPDTKPRVLRGYPGKLDHGALAFDPQGRWLATGSETLSGDKTARLWDLQHPEEGPRELRGHKSEITTLAFDPLGRWLATGSWDSTVRLWDLQHPEAGSRELRGHEQGINALAFDPQGRWLASGSLDKTARLWDPQHPQDGARVLRGHQNMIMTLAFDPLGRWLATGSADHTARLWDLRQPERKALELRGHEDAIQRLAFDPLGRWLATGSEDKTARLWDLQHLETEPQVLVGHEDTIMTLAFDPLGRWLATGSADKTTRLWQLDGRVLLDQACQTAGRNLAPEEWRQHVGDLPYQATCPQFPSGEAVIDKPASEGT